MSQTVPDFTTAIVTISFLLVLAVIALIVKFKSGSLKKNYKKTRLFRSFKPITIEEWLYSLCFKGW